MKVHTGHSGAILTTPALARYPRPAVPHPSSHNQAPSLSDADVRRLARLARLAIPDSEIPALRDQLGAILRHADALRALDLTGVEPQTSPIDATAPMRNDEPGPTIATETFLQMAPETVPPFLKVPKVLGESSA